MRRFFKIVGIEFRTIFHDEGVLLVLIGALVLYSGLYGLIYEPEVVRKMPIAVVDMDKTEASAELTRQVDATPATEIAYWASSLDDARQLFLEHKVVGIFVIDKGFESNRLTHRQAHVSIYADGSYFLLYSSFLGAMADVVVSKHEIAPPVDYKIEMLYNPYNGYATSLLPAVLVVILQQVLLIGMGMVLGGQNEFKKWGQYDGSSALSITFGKALSYFVIYVPLVVYLFWVDYKVFHYPMREQTWDLVLFILPYLLSVIFMGLTLGALLRRRESSILYLAVFSVFLIMVSGVSWPAEGMPSWMYYGGMVLPSSSAIDGFVRLRTAGASLADVSQQWVILWVLTFIYATTAVISISRARK